MVTYTLIEKTESQIFYEYYPEGKMDRKPGVILVDRINEKIELLSAAEDDFERYAEEFNEHWWCYYNHAKRRIVEDYNKGIINESGVVAWY